MFVTSVGICYLSRTVKKFLLHSLFLLLAFGEASGQTLPPQIRMYDLDSLGYEWTAVASNDDFTYSLVFFAATLPEIDSLSPETNFLRLREYRGIGGNVQTPITRIYPGKMRVTSMELVNTQLFLGGFFTDTSALDSHSLIPQQIGVKKAFMAALNLQNNRIQWVWQDSTSGSSQIHQVRHSTAPGTAPWLTLSGTVNDSTGMLVVLNANTGQVVFQRIFPGIRVLSDAIVANPAQGLFLLTGACSDSGYIGQIPIPLSGAQTGIRSFIAEYNPAINAAVFTHSLPYTRFDFLASFGTKDHWSIPTATDTSTHIKQMMYPAAPETWWQNYIWHIDNYIANKHAGRGFAGGTNSWGSYIHTFSNGLITYWQLRCTVCAYRDFEIYADTWGSKPKVLFSLTSFSNVIAVPFKWILEAMYRDGADIIVNDSLVPFQHKWGVVWLAPSYGSVAHDGQQAFHIYPNPVNQGQFKIQTEMPFDQPAAWTLRDVQGRTVRQGQLTDASETVQVGDVPTGMYFFELVQAEGSRFAKIMIHNQP